MTGLVFIVGGIRSGKTRLALTWARAQGVPGLMLATCAGQDAEMAARIAAHKKERGNTWLTLEDPLEPWGALSDFLARNRDFAGPVVLDSLGMWISNLMYQNLSTRSILLRIRHLIGNLLNTGLPCAVVSEECGLGFVPLTAIARKYADVLGTANQIVASLARTAIFVVCGLPIVLKGTLPFALQGGENAQ